ncbi:cation transport protein-domain-containing protein [Xylariaceae sp. FL0594]|nr:cation transport protein-domain-containing protein [Xylariaceae sp. FL0594]
MGRKRELLVRWAQAIRPPFLARKPHYDFITFHYTWIVGLTILGSILIYATAHGELAYIDALAFAAGANTQAGLNTVDVNLLNTFQQLVMYFCSLVSNPISIHGSVVFLRLFFFEKRFISMTKNALMARAPLSLSRSRAKQTEDGGDRRVNGASISVVPGSMALGNTAVKDVSVEKESPTDGRQRPQFPAQNSSSSEGDSEQNPQDGEGPRPDATQIRFADKVRRSDAPGGIDDDEEEDPIPLPERRSNAEHIAILEKQRKADNKRLRIPGPRDADMGAVPEELDEDSDEDAQGMRRRRESSLESPQVGHRRLPYGDRQPTITIAEPEHPRREESNIPEEAVEDLEAARHVFGDLRRRVGRKSETELERTETSSTFRRRVNPLQRIKSVLTQGKEDEQPPYLSWQPTIGRNSQFVDLTEEQRDELGGIEYRSLKTLALVLVVYFVGYSLFGIITLVPWIVHNNPFYTSLLKSDGINPVWWGFWTANSAFMDLGFTLTPDSMNSFNTAILPLLVMSLLIILGNTGFPVALRFMIWLASLVVPRNSGIYEELRFLLDHPRRCFTLLFPANANWWLFFILCVLNGLDLLLFIVLDLGRGPISQLPLNIRFLDGWFQAASTRTAGFSCLNLSELHPAVQTSYLIMMYISVFPVAISMRRTNVYEEQSLGVYDSVNDVDEDQQGSISYVGTHLRRQLSFDLWYVFLGFFVLTISEGGRIMAGEFSMFAILFEVVSAYGTVGLSLGYPGVNASLCSQFTVVGKLVIIAMMIRGRHRGLPYGLDRAVLLPSEKLNRKEAEEAEQRLQRRQSVFSLAPSERRPSSLRSVGRTRSVDRRSMVTGFFHPGPSYYSMARSRSEAKSEARSDQASAFGRPDTLRKYTSAGSSRIVQRAETQPPTASDL